MDEEDQEKVQWMRSVYREIPLDSPVLKRVKASDIHRQLKLRYAVQCSHHREAGLVQRAFSKVESKLAGKSRAAGTGARCLCLLVLGNVEVTVCPGEVTSTQELRAVSNLRMHSPECTVQQTQGIQLFIRTA